MGYIGAHGGVWIETGLVFGPCPSYLFIFPLALALFSLPLLYSALSHGLDLVISLAWTIFQLAFHVNVMSLTLPNLPTASALRIARTTFFLTRSWTTSIVCKTMARTNKRVLIPLAIIISIYTNLVVLEGWFHFVLCIHSLGHIAEESGLGSVRVRLVESLVSACFRCEEGLELPQTSEIEDVKKLRHIIYFLIALKAYLCMYPPRWRPEMWLDARMRNLSARIHRCTRRVAALNSANLLQCGWRRRPPSYFSFYYVVQMVISFLEYYVPDEGDRRMFC